MIITIREYSQLISVPACVCLIANGMYDLITDYLLCKSDALKMRYSFILHSKVMCIDKGIRRNKSHFKLPLEIFVWEFCTFHIKYSLLFLHFPHSVGHIFDFGYFFQYDKSLKKEHGDSNVFMCWWNAIVWQIFTHLHNEI